MCGRYALSLRPSQVRQRLAEQNMPSDEAPDDNDEQLRQSYNFAPGYHGLVYRAATSDRGTDSTPLNNNDNDENDGEPSPKKAKFSHPDPDQQTGRGATVDGLASKETKFKLQAAKWGLIPFWTKRSPDYGSMLRTINCRDDSLAQNGGMWNTMKQRKRCIVLADGFYEWLKKGPGGKEKVPHYVKRKDGGLMCFAGLWDCVQYEGESDKLYTYTIITTDSNKQIRFLHDRMPVILEPGSEAMRKWLDPGMAGWNRELQGMLKPFGGELECYPVDRAVGKVGNNSPSFVVPVDSKENKKNIANFFGNQKASPQRKKAEGEDVDVKKEEPGEERDTTVKAEDLESNAPLPIPKTRSEEECSLAIEKEADEVDDDAMIDTAQRETEKGIKQEADDLGDEDLLEAENSPPRKEWKSPSKPKAAPPSPNKKDSQQQSTADNGHGPSMEEQMNDEDLLEAEKSPPRKTWSSPSKPRPTPSPVKASQTSGKASSTTRSATTNNTTPKTPQKEGNKKITAFFGGK